MKTIAAYTHETPIAEVPDTAPGPYYVSCLDDFDRLYLVSGPYDKHADAIAMRGKARRICEQHEPRCVWWRFGTVRMRDSFKDPGQLQRIGEYDLNLELPKPKPKRKRKPTRNRVRGAESS